MDVSKFDGQMLNHSIIPRDIRTVEDFKSETHSAHHGQIELNSQVL